MASSPPQEEREKPCANCAVGDGNSTLARFGRGGLSRGRRRRGVRGGLDVLTIADESRPDHNHRHPGPAYGRDLLVEEPDGGEGRENKTEPGKRPEKTDFAFGHQD